MRRTLCSIKCSKQSIFHLVVFFRWRLILRALLLGKAFYRKVRLFARVLDGE